jgi:TonB family protein
MNSRVFALLGLLLSLPVACLQAQDAFATDPAFLSPETTTADAPPRFKHKVHAEYPDDLKKEDVQGYALTFWRIDPAGGKVIVANAATHPLFGGVLGMLGREEGATTPMLKDGKPVAGLIWHSVIFNPASAGTKKKDASPRLLAVAPAQVTPKELGKVKPPELPYTWVKLQLDATGAITSFELENPEAEKFKPAIATALKAWRFAPARHGGEPIAVEWRAPVVICPDFRAVVNRLDQVPPKVLRAVEPVYPRALVRDDIRGEVKLNCLIDEQGKVKEIVVESSSHPVFSKLAIAAMEEWKFAPATKAGKPVSTKISQSFHFAPDGMDVQSGQNAVRIEKPKNLDKLPPELRYDTPPKATGVALPVYPHAQWVAKTKGKASVAMVVDANGNVSQTKILEASSPEFGLALAAAVEESTFTPALKDGQPIPAAVRRNHDFLPSGSDILSTDQDRDMLKVIAKHPERIVAASALDKAIKPTLARKPLIPTAHRQSGATGSATLEMIIDQEGRVLLPQIIEASAPEFGYAAVQAVKQWTFVHPTVDGKPVYVRVRIPIDFVMPESAKKS